MGAYQFYIVSSLALVRFLFALCVWFNIFTVELQWLEHLLGYENMFETGVVRANEC